MKTLQDLERRIALDDPTLTPGDFVRAHNRVDDLYAQYSAKAKARADQFTKRHAAGPRLSLAVGLIGKELALPVGDRI